MREDPVFYERFSKLIQQAIDDFRARRISEIEYLRRVREIREGVARRPDDAVPPEIRDDATARAVYGVIRELFGNDDRPEVVAMSAKALVEIVKRRSIVN